MTTLSLTLTERYIPRVAPWLRDLGLVMLGSLVVALFAQVEIPLKPVPITGQTFAVLLVGAAVGSKRGAAALALYLGEGLIGMPFYSGGASGITHLIGATGGYLISFIPAAYVIGRMAERGLERSVRTSILPFLIGTAIIYAGGVTWLAVVLGSFSQAILLGLLPFLAGDAIKLIAASLALPAAWKLVQ